MTDLFADQVFIPVIVVLVYLIAELLKVTIMTTDARKKALPIICGCIGAIIGVLMFFFYPTDLGNMTLSAAIINGTFSGFAATGCNQIYKKVKEFFNDDSKSL